MCLIIDVNVAADVLVTAKNQYGSISKGLTNGSLRLVYGGELFREYQQVSHVMKILLILDRSGVAIKFSDELVDLETEVVKKIGTLSNDQHVIALARVSNARILITNDKLLQTDFLNKNLIKSPRGSVYKNKNHDHLLKKKCN